MARPGTVLVLAGLAITAGAGLLVYAGLAAEARAEQGGRLAAVCEGWCARAGGAVGVLELSLAQPVACGCLIGGRMVFDPRFGERFAVPANRSPGRVAQARGW